MSADNWMRGHEISDVQTAIQSSTIQTALEANTSKITDAGFQSYLTNAPIPRCAGDTPTGTYTGGGAVSNVIWSNKIFDPYGILNSTTGIIVAPISGFYQVGFSVTGTVTANTQIRLM